MEIPIEGNTSAVGVVSIAVVEKAKKPGTKRKSSTAARKKSTKQKKKSAMGLRAGLFYGATRDIVRGNRTVSLMSSAFVIHLIRRSMPSPKPPCGTDPYFRRSRYQS
jgi:hypothetical protein